MSFAKLAALAVNRPRVLLLVTLLPIVAGIGLLPRFESNLLGLGYQTPNTESARATDFIERATGFTETDVIVVSSKTLTFADTEFKATVDRILTAVRAEDNDLVVLPPGVRGGGLVSKDRHAVTATVAMTGDVGERQDLAADLQDVIDEAAGPGFEAGLTGNSPVLEDLIKVEETDMLKAEAIGLPIALVLLLLAFGSIVAALLPVMLAYGGLLAAIGAVAVSMFFMDFNAFVETFIVMLGLALGIDYSLLFVRRFREERRAGGTSQEIIERTLKTAGRTVVFSGAIFSAAILPLAFTRLPFFYDSAVAIIAVVFCEVVLLVTLMPVVLLKLGDRLDKGKLRGKRGDGDRLAEGSERWGRWARGVMRRPVPYLVLGAVVLVAAAVPVLDIKTGIDLNVRAMEGEESVKPLAELDKHFGNAAVSPVEVLVRAEPDAVNGATAAAVATLKAQKFAEISPLSIAPDATLLLATPTAKIDSLETFEQIKKLRTALAGTVRGGEALVTGVTAETVDYAQKTEDVEPWVIAGALGLSFLLLMALFRSPLLATKAIVMNLLSIGAALGLTVLLFQEGHAESILGFESPGYLQSWTPLTLLVMLFALSMDYEVFMVSRIREEYDRRGDTAEAVAHGLHRTGSVVTYAAFIMIAIFGAFMLSTIPEMKQLGFALAVAVLIDATIVRAILVPAFMRIAGKWNWWMPRWLDALLPELRHEAP